MTDEERREAERRFKAFQAKYPGFMKHMPAVIFGVGAREVCILDATHADLNHYADFLEARIARRQRRRRRA